MVERLVANEKVEGSSPFARSINIWMTFIKKNRDDSHFLEKKFKFNNFLDSQRFINFVSEISENEGHHPDIIFGWGYAKIKIFTHAIKGLAESDFILAAKVDQL